MSAPAITQSQCMTPVAHCQRPLRRKPASPFLTALPLISILALTLAYLEHRDMVRINQYALSILVAVPLSLVFFAPFVLNHWLKMNFAPSLALGLFLLFLAYLVHGAIFR